MTNNNEKINRNKNSILVLSIGLFAFSLTKECYCTDADCASSLIAFLLGWIGACTGGAAIAWLSNPLLIASWFLTKKSSKYALFISILATLFCLSFLLFNKVIRDEAGNYTEIISRESGYWLWTGSAAIMLVGNLILRQKEIKTY